MAKRWQRQGQLGVSGHMLAGSGSGGGEGNLVVSRMSGRVGSIRWRQVVFCCGHSK
jgi:hypothetical protein